MLQNTFVMLDGIGPQRERTLWRRGIWSWKDFIDETRVPGISADNKSRMDHELVQADAKLRSADSSYFAYHLPRKEQWRCIGDFRKSVAFLDIETTGISCRSPITVVGIYDGVRMHTLVRGQNLTRTNLQGILSGATIMVTFNGSSFDIPMIEAQFPGVVPGIPHIDLRHPMRRLGYSGGLKAIERELDIVRDRRVEYMTGEDAVYLWNLWERHGKKNALDLLIEYNSEDCKNLKCLSEFAYRNLKRTTFDSARG
ncbi:MAG: hypothetical protein A3K60_08380 [Euryarchaeota archaeon RBG_19FT_COMBO_56_21]|nr:MAG: hypothetical protein A3K60_08380 [Euryarchaeota archaeon RBG_19FT_COMBO_56_21]